MHRRRLVLATALVLPGLPAFAQSRLLELFSGTSAGATTFVERATMADNFEIESSRILLAKSIHPQIREFAQRMIEDHTSMGAELRAMPDATTRLPSGLDDRLQARLIELRGYDGDELNRWYVQMQVEIHQQAVELYRAYAENGEVPALKAFAQRHLPEIRNHLERAQALQAPRE